MDDISQRTKTGLKIRFLTDDKEGEVEERGRDRFGQRFVTERAQVLETFCPPRRDQEVGARVSIFSPGTEQRFSQFKQDVWCRPLFDLETDDQSWKRFVSISWSRSVSVSIIRGREIVGKRCIRGRRGWEKTPWLIARFGGRDQRSRFVASSSRFLASATLESGNRWIAKLKGEPTLEWEKKSPFFVIFITNVKKVG